MEQNGTKRLKNRKNRRKNETERTIKRNGTETERFVGQVGHPGTVLECPSNYGTQDAQTQGLCGASRTSRDSPGVSE